jgi:hypothetical protein
VPSLGMAESTECIDVVASDQVDFGTQSFPIGTY